MSIRLPAAALALVVVFGAVHPPVLGAPLEGSRVAWMFVGVVSAGLLVVALLARGSSRLTVFYGPQVVLLAFVAWRVTRAPEGLEATEEVLRGLWILLSVVVVVLAAAQLDRRRCIDAIVAATACLVAAGIMWSLVDGPARFADAGALDLSGWQGIERTSTHFGLTAAVLVAASAASTHHRIPRRVGLLALGGVAVIATGSTTAIVVVVAAGATALQATLPARRRRWVGLAAASTITLCLLAGPGLLDNDVMRSADERLELWADQAEWVAERPIFGHGSGSTATRVEAVHADLVEAGQVGVGSVDRFTLRNLWLHVFADNGFVGVMILFAMLVVYVRRREVPDRADVFVVAWLVASLAEYSMADSPDALSLSLAAALTQAGRPLRA